MIDIFDADTHHARIIPGPDPGARIGTLWE